jgi:hypothetical protein
MTIETVEGADAWRNVVLNKFSKWPTRQNPDRLHPLAKPEISTKFSINKTEKVFCIGSCFAREVEQALQRIGFDVLSIIRNLPSSPRRSVSDAGLFNKYTIASVLNELGWALDNQSDYSLEKILIENVAGLFEDYQLAGSEYADEISAAAEFRNAFRDSFRVIKDASIVVITLGLSEAWFDLTTGLYLNKAPSRAVVQKYPNRFILKVLDYNDSLEMLESCYKLLSKYLNPGFKILITVSPVPLLATFRNQDVLVANAYSKALLRTVVEKFQSDKSNVNYFPSYEFVTLSNPSVVWSHDDFRHVDRFFVDYIMSAVVEAFCGSSSSVFESSLLARSSAFYRGGFLAEAEALLRDHLDNYSLVENPKLILRWGMVNRKLGRIKIAQLAYKEYLVRCPNDEKSRATFENLSALHD